MSKQRARSLYSDAKVTPLSQPAERVQASLFAAILRQEVETMSRNVINAQADWRSRCDAEGYVEPPERLVLVHDRLAEAVRMLDAKSSRSATWRKRPTTAMKLDPDELRHMSDADIAVELINVRGIGRWSAEIFLMFHTRRLDVWPTGDFSVRVGYAGAWGVEVPTPKVLDALGDPFRPYRSVVAYYTWKISADPDVFAAGATSAVT